jgi:Xaa-Pro aminopeptidase
MPDTPPFYDHVTITEGDRMIVEPLPAYKGYVGSCCRTYQIGELTDEAYRSVECIEQAQTAAINTIKSGVDTRALVKAIHRVFEDMGYKSSIEMAGHGIGLGGHEPPMLTNHGDTVLEEGMVLAVEIWKYDISGFAYSDSKQGRKNLGIFANEDLVVVTKQGADRLPYFHKDILSLPHNPG